MNSNLLNSLGMGSLDIGIVLLVFAALIFILLIICLVLIVELSKFKKRYNRFSQGRDARSMEEEIGSLFEENTKLRAMTEKNHRDIKVIYRTLEKTYQKVGLVKYDAFAQMGGKLSFALCMLNEKNTGFIINSVHGSDGCYSYSKEIKNGACDLVLGEEEQKALNIAMQI